MEVDKIAFAPRLLEVLEAISEAHFVTFDLELSGIASRTPQGDGKQTIQERYKQTKEAAERFQILQIGITCAREDVARNVYQLKPYNFNLNPLLEEKLDVERIFAWQSGAIEFLFQHGFDATLPFKHGVPYLSRDEAESAKRLARDRLDRSKFQDLQLLPDDTQSLAFLDRVRHDINDWLNKMQSHELLILSATPVAAGKDVVADLGRFEKRLVHQVVRAEFPHLVTVSQRDCIRIIPFDESRENEIKRRRMQVVKQQISRQTGFRWIVEALCGGPLHRIDLTTFARDPHTGEAVFVDMDDYRARFFRLEDALKRRRPVLVGHNMFTDIIYFYRTFLGALPDTLEEFREEIHKLFPTIVDTKYLGTHNCGDINQKSSLEELEENLRGQASPLIEVHQKHTKYTNNQAFHEAGYDSFLTARVMILLSAKLEAAGVYVEESKLLEPTTDEEVFFSADETDAHVQNIVDSTASRSWDTTDPVVALSGTQPRVIAPSIEHPEASLLKKQRKKRVKRSKKSTKNSLVHENSPSSNTRFAQPTVFSRLRQLSLDEDADDDDASPDDTLQTPKLTHHVAPTANGPDPCAWASPSARLDPRALPFFAPSGSSSQEPEADQGAIGSRKGLMPGFGSDFWRVYGNKLRVFGTVEGVFPLTRTRD